MGKKNVQHDIRQQQRGITMPATTAGKQPTGGTQSYFKNF